MWSKLKKRKVLFLICFLAAMGTAQLTLGQEKGKTAVSSAELQRCVENKKREASQRGDTAFDLMELRFACYQEIMRGKKY